MNTEFSPDASLRFSSTEIGSFCFVDRNGTAQSLLDDAVSSEVDRDFSPGAVIHERYFLTRILGRGGMGRVLLATDQLLRRQVAMKVVALRWEGREQRLQEALAREARLGASLSDPGIAAVYDFGIHAGKCFTIFEYIEGQSLREILQQARHLSLEEVRRLISGLAQSLDFAHGQGVVHRDLKPENIIVARNGQPRILDFGIARDLRRDFDFEGYCGTPQYASPEQAACLPTDGRTDQYALALLAWEMLAGRPLFSGRHPLELLHRHRDMPPGDLRTHRADLPDSAAAAVHRALRKDPRDRFETCRAFAGAFCEREPDAANSPADLVPLLQKPLGAFLCHVSDDSLVARHLADHLSRQGFSTWYFQRDALPGISFVAQTTDAIRRSAATVLLISRRALRSEEFSREVREASQHARPFVPLLVGMSRDEFETHQPPWRPLLGVASVIELERGRTEPIFDRLPDALRLLGVQPDLTPAAEARNQPRDIHGQIWATDASQIDVHDLSRLVFRSQLVDEFLNRRNKYFLSGTKGIGKTLLLTFKRHLLTQMHSREDTAATLCFVPHGRPYLDFMSELRSLSARFEKPLADLNTTKRFWSLALRVSAVSTHPDVIAADEADELLRFPSRFRRWLKGARIEPTVVFKELTDLSISQANSLVDDTETFLDQKLRAIHSATWFFIDKVDQAVRQLSRDAWINVQAGLIEAAWDLMNANSHLKVFASIRHEAFVNYQSDIKSNLLGATSILRYSDPELEGLLDRLASCYETSSGFKDFLGIRVLRHERRPVPEDSFRFIRRHSFGRPRDLVVIAAELSTQRAALSEARYCELVRQASASRLVASIFEEMRVFLDCLGDLDTRTRFLRELPANIICREEAIAICARFNGISPEVIRQIGDTAVEIFHPFQDLYLAGLLGVIARQPDSDDLFQNFRQPDDLVNPGGADLPVSACYFLHPALSSFVSTTRTSGDFLMSEHIVVGHRLSWESGDEIFWQAERAAAIVSSAELRQLVHLLLRQARETLLGGNPRNLPLVLQAMPEWTDACSGLLREGHEDVVLWLEELRNTP